MKHEKFVPLQKMSKKAKKKTLSSKRATWDGLNPVTRVDNSIVKYKKKRQELKGKDD